MFVAHVSAGEEVVDAITRQARERGVTNAAVTFIGAVKGCTVSVMPKGDETDDIRTARWDSATAPSTAATTRVPMRRARAGV